MDTIRLMAGKGYSDFLEVGPGAVLTGLLRGIDASLAGRKFGEPEDLEKLGI
jgi:[acyl-carrier-protein] S-malonyltransferase